MKHRKLFFALGALLLLHAVLGFLILPMIARRIAVQELTKALGRNVVIEQIRFNPYTLSVTVSKARIDEAQGGEFLLLEAFHINFELWSSLFHRTWVFKDGALMGPHVKITRNADGTASFADLLLLDWPKVPPFRLDVMRLSGGRVVFRDESLPSELATTISPLTGSVTDFSMSPEHESRYAFTAVSEAGEKLSWKGSLRLDPLSSHGELAAQDVQVSKYYPYFEEFLSFTIASGALTARATYDLDLSRAHPEALLTDGTIEARALDVYERESEAPLVGFAKLELDGARVDLWRQTIEVASIVVTGGSATVRRLADGSFNVEHVIEPAPAPPEAKAASHAGWQVSVGEVRLLDFGAEVSPGIGRGAVRWKELLVSEPAFQMNPPTASVAAITLTDGAIVFTDQPSTPVKMALTALDIRIGALSSESSRGADVAIKAKLDNDARLQISGRTNPISSQGATNLRGLLKNVKLVSLSPYAAKYLGYELENGELNLDVKCLIEHRKLKVRSSIEITHLALGDKTKSKYATTLPVPLVITLLKDVRGKITLDVPITGTLDDPKFKLKTAIIAALLDPLRKIAAPPFAEIVD